MIIAGLGNPGPEYDRTRHNLGFIAVDALTRHFRTQLSGHRCRARVGEFSFKGSRHLLVKPQTYMNLSGESLGPLLQEERATPAELIVIIDDVCLPVGKVRIKPNGSAGGHNGLKSIIGSIGEGFWRIRIGVGSPDGNLVAHVLGPISQQEHDVLLDVVKDIPQMVCLLMAGMGSRAMSVFNGKSYLPEPEPALVPSPPHPRAPLD
ncbi:MAG TPA: aminoacyl-tRNA hydrolase [Candidatus Ozemobacteraceae bacterium]|nr:aminoacyl-tRNA hydrolase [Candidatus Ozemobacteraceae bacterium]